MDVLANSSLIASQPLCKLTTARTRSAKRKAYKFAAFASTTADTQQRASAPATDVSRRKMLQQIALATAALSLDTAVNLSAPQQSDAYLVQFPVADLRNQYYLVRPICTAELTCICQVLLHEHFV